MSAAHFTATNMTLIPAECSALLDRATTRQHPPMIGYVGLGFLYLALAPTWRDRCSNRTTTPPPPPASLLEEGLALRLRAVDLVTAGLKPGDRVASWAGGAGARAGRPQGRLGGVVC